MLQASFPTNILPSGAGAISPAAISPGASRPRPSPTSCDLSLVETVSFAPNTRLVVDGLADTGGSESKFQIICNLTLWGGHMLTFCSVLFCS